MFIESESEKYIEQQIYDSKEKELESVKKSVIRNNTETIAIVIGLAEYSDAKKKFIIDQHKYKGHNVHIFLAKYNELEELNNAFYFDNIIIFNNIFYKDFCYYVNLTEENIIKYIKDKYKYNHIYIYI
jgi:hypothetical protein